MNKSILPILLAAAIPLPSDQATPPVMKIFLVRLLLEYVILSYPPSIFSALLISAGVSMPENG